MRVLHVISSVDPRFGGPAIALRALASSLQAHGIDVAVAALTSGSPGDAADQAWPGGVPLWLFPRQTHLYGMSVPLTHWLWRRVERYDLIHVHGLFTYPSTVAGGVARMMGKPYIVRPFGVLNRWGMTRRRPHAKRLSWLLIERRLLAGAAAIHYTSEAERWEAEVLGITTRSFVLAPGFSLPTPHDPVAPARFRARYPALRDRPVVLFLSRLDPKKGLEPLLQAMVELYREAPEVVLVVAGDGEPRYVRRMRALAAELGLVECCLWLGHVDGVDKQDLLAAADVCVLPSHSENFGLAALEAMAAGLPTVLGEGVALGVAAERAGACVRAPVDPDRIRIALGDLLRDGARRDRLAARARDFAHGFSIDRVSEQLIREYELAIEGRTI